MAFREDTTDDLIQQGRQTFWITEAGSADEDRSFDDFCKAILGNEVTIDARNLVLTYISKGRKYRLDFGAGLSVNDRPVNTEYDRYDSPYSKAAKKADTITFQFNGKSLHLDFCRMIRDFR